MEYWVRKADDVLILISDPCHLCKKRVHSAKPIIPMNFDNFRQGGKHYE
jgi:hypothetical protein